MFALIDNQQITKFFSGNRGVTLGDVQYPKSIFTLWSEAERNAIGIYEVTVDTTNKKDEQWYTNTNISYGVESNKAVGSYGTATAKAHTDVLFTAQDEIDGLIPDDKDVGDVKTEGLKTELIRAVKAQAGGELRRTDWYVVRKADAGTAIPSAITTHRAAVRTKAAEQETAITNAADTPALETLYAHTRQEDGSVTRPLGQIPTLES